MDKSIDEQLQPKPPAGAFVELADISKMSDEEIDVYAGQVAALPKAQLLAATRAKQEGQNR